MKYSMRSLMIVVLVGLLVLAVRYALSDELGQVAVLVLVLVGLRLVWPR